MARPYRRIAKRFLLILNWVIAVLFLGACIGPYLPPADWWILSILGLGFGILLFVLILFVPVWAVFRSRNVFISLVALVLGYKAIVSFFAINNRQNFAQTKAPGSLRVVQWNVARFVEWKRNNNKGNKKRREMLAQIKAQDADVLCLQEFFHSTDSTLWNNLDVVQKELGYPYVHYSWDPDGPDQWVGQAIFSRHPIIDSSLVRYPRPGMPETLISADVVYGADTLRIFTTHLQSVQFKPADYARIEEIKNRDDSLLNNAKGIFAKLRRAQVYRSRQAHIVREATRVSPLPYLICGDFNDVPNSYTYHTIRGDLQDAFLEKGLGVGRTFSGISPTLRIDYMLVSPLYEVRQFKKVESATSDHYMLVMDVGKR